MVQRSLKAASLALLCAGAAGCSSIPRPDFASATHAAHREADVVSNTADDRFPGVSAAVKAPLRDFNLVEDDVPVVLVRAYQRPYDTTGLTTCKAVADQVASLDLFLGPDVDIPRPGSGQKGMMDRGRQLAAEGALDAVRAATTGSIPVRSWIRRLTGAKHDEEELKAVVLAGAVRRGFLKAVGVELHCVWPAAPLDLQSAQLKAQAAEAPPEAGGPGGPGGPAPR